MLDRVQSFTLAGDPLRPSAGRAQSDFVPSGIPCRHAGAHARCLLTGARRDEPVFRQDHRFLRDQSLSARRLVRDAARPQPEIPSVGLDHDIAAAGRVPLTQ